VGNVEFDELAKTLAAPISRRRALRVFATGLGASVFALGGLDTADAFRCRQVGQRCREDSECCGYHGNATGSCNPATGRCYCPPPNDHECAKTRQCVQCDPSTQTFNPTTCQCECNTGYSACVSPFGSFFCCPPNTQCCSGSVAASCCPTGQCCPSGYCAYNGQCS
jgi:hypothetical protein